MLTLSIRGRCFKMVYSIDKDFKVGDSVSGWCDIKCRINILSLHTNRPTGGVRAAALELPSRADT